MREHFSFQSFVLLLLMMIMYLKNIKLRVRKATHSNEAPVKILKQKEDFFDYICNFFHFCVNECKYPNILKQVNITSSFKKRYRGSNESNRPLSILLAVVKVFEKLLNK